MPLHATDALFYIHLLECVIETQTTDRDRIYTSLTKYNRELSYNERSAYLTVLEAAYLGYI